MAVNPESVQDDLRLLKRATARLNQIEQKLPIYVYGWPIDKTDDPNYGRPHPKQARFHGSKAMTRLICGGNRTGKSHSGVAEDTAHALGFRPWLPKDHPDYWVLGGNGKRIPIPNKGFIGGESFPQIAKVIVPKLLGDPDIGIPGIIPEDMIQSTKKNQAGVVCLIKLTNGSRIEIRSYEQEPRHWEGDDMDWGHFDEPPPRTHYIAAKRGMTDRMARCWFTMTPLSQAWIKKEIVDKTEDEGRSIEAWEVDIQDNVGYGLTQKAVDEYAATLNDDEKEMRLHGRFFHLTGLIYKEFKRDVHLVPRHAIPSTYQIYFHLDIHPRKPDAAIWIGVRPDGHKFVIGELKNKHKGNLTVPFCADILDYERRFLRINSSDVVRLIDPLSQSPDKKGGSVLLDFAEKGVSCVPGSKDRTGAMKLTHQALAHNEAMGVFPDLQFFDDLPEIRTEIENYTWKEPPKSRSEAEVKEEPLKVDDDLIEGVHRILRHGAEPKPFEDEDEYEYEPIGEGYSDGYSG